MKNSARQAGKSGKKTAQLCKTVQHKIADVEKKLENLAKKTKKLSRNGADTP